MESTLRRRVVPFVPIQGLETAYPPIFLHAIHCVLSWVLDQAPARSTVRVYCHMLTDPHAIDLIIHHGADKTIRIILHPDDKNKSCLEEFFQDYGRVARRAFHDRLYVRVANTALYCGNNYCCVHDKSIITVHHCTFGSYDLSCPARYQNWESLYIADMEPWQVERFDQIWNSLAHRTIQNVYADLAPPSSTGRHHGGSCADSPSGGGKRAQSSAQNGS